MSFYAKGEHKKEQTFVEEGLQICLKEVRLFLLGKERIPTKSTFLREGTQWYPLAHS